MFKHILIALALATAVMAYPQNITANLPENMMNHQAAIASNVQTSARHVETLRATLTMTTSKLDQIQRNAETMEMDLDTMWLILGAVLVLVLTLGFTLIEAAAARRASLGAVLTKNLVVLSVVALTWWAWGYGVAYAATVDDSNSDNAFIGNGKVFMANDKIEDAREYARWLFSYAFAAFATAVATSTLTDRGSLAGYTILSFLFSGGIYPVMVHWVWASNGWLNVRNSNENFGNNGMIDYSGSAVVCVTAGTVAFVAAAIAGPRLRRFDADFNGANPSRFQQVNKVYQGFGVILLWVGWYGVTCVSSQFYLEKQIAGARSAQMVKIAVNTTLGAAAGGFFAFAVDSVAGAETVDKQYLASHPEETQLPTVKRTDIRATLNGVVSGLVATAAGIAVVEPWACFVVGGIAGAFAVVIPRVTSALGIDDPVDTFTMFLWNGMWGVVSVGWFSRPESIRMAYHTGPSFDIKHGIFYGGDAHQWGVQIFGFGAIFLWSLVMGAVVCVVLNIFGALRVDEATESRGIDAPVRTEEEEELKKE